MKALWLTTRAVLTALGGFLGTFLGGFDGFLYALIAFTAVDYITGVLRAVAERQLSSRLGARGIVKKVVIFLIVGVANVTDVHLLHDGGALRMAVVFFYASNEGVSILENAVAIGLPVPGKLRKALAQIRRKGNGEGNGKGDTTTAVGSEVGNGKAGNGKGNGGKAGTATADGSEVGNSKAGNGKAATTTTSATTTPNTTTPNNNKGGDNNEPT